MERSRDRKNILYIFLDEGGNLDFSQSGTKFFTLTSLSKYRPFEAYRYLCDLKYDLIETGIDIEFFHASEDKQDVRDQVFEIINSHLDQTRIDNIVVEKSKTGPALREDLRFYPEMLGYLLSYVINGYDVNLFEKIIVFTDRLPIKKKRRAIEKAIKKVLSDKLPSNIRYQILHHDSKSNFDLQIVDYCNWAIYRKWSAKDLRSYEIIKRVIRSEFDIFEKGCKHYY